MDSGKWINHVLTWEKMMKGTGGVNFLSTIKVDNESAGDGDGAGCSVSSINCKIEGLRCPSCVQKVEDELLGTHGVKNVRANLTKGRLYVSWHTELISWDSVYNIATGLGYKLSPLNSRSPKDDLQAKGLLKALGVATLVMMNVVMLAIGIWANQDMGLVTRKLFYWIQFGLVGFGLIYSGRVFFVSAYNSLKARRMNMDVSISTAMILSYCMSAVVLVYDKTGIFEVYFDSVSMLLCALLVGRYMESRVSGKVGDAIEELFNMQQSTVKVLVDGVQVVQDVGQVKPGARIIIGSGEIVPLDGLIVEGQSTLDTRVVNGETKPSQAKPGVYVFAGMRNQDAALTMQVKAMAVDSFLSRTIQIINQAEKSRSGYVRLADKLSRFYVPCVYAMAIISFAVWYIFAGASWLHSVEIAVAVLVITCPCALGLAVPLVQSSMVRMLLGSHVLVKHTQALERLSQVDTVVFDKTGTLTDGNIQVQKVLGKLDEQAWLDIVAMTSQSRHVLSMSVTRYAMQVMGVACKDDQHIEHVHGNGIENRIGMRLGKMSWCMDSAQMMAGMTLDEQEQLAAWQGSVVGFWDPVRHLSGVILLSESMRKGAGWLITYLRARSIHMAILSGDAEAPVSHISSLTGIEDYHSSCMPGDKMDFLKRHKRALMIGDGINDAPALRQAMVSMSFSCASQIAQNSADMLIMNDNLASVATAIQASKLWVRLVKQNFVFAIGYNICAVPLAMAGWVTPFIAALLMSMSSIVVVVNSAYRKRLPTLDIVVVSQKAGK